MRRSWLSQRLTQPLPILIRGREPRPSGRWRRLRVLRSLKKRVAEALSSKLHSTTRLYFTIGLTVTLVIAVASVAEVISYTSVAATTIQLVSVSRILPEGLSPPYIAFEAQVLVYTKGALLPAHLDGLTFDLTVDTTYIATISSTEITINPYDQHNYTLEFQMNNPRIAATLAERSSNYIGIVMTTLARAGLHQQRIVRSDSAIWTRSG